MACQKLCERFPFSLGAVAPLQPTSIGSICNFPTVVLFRRHGSLFTGHSPLPAPTRHSPFATRHSPPTVPPKSASFARSIPLWFVLSYNLPTTNTRAIWLRFGAFLTPLLSPHLRLFNLTGHWPLFPRHLPPEPPSAGTSGVRSCADLPPLAIAGEPTAEFPMNSRVLFCIFVHFRLPPPVHGASGSRAPAQRLPKTELGPISTSAPSISLFTEPGDSCGQINPFSPTRRRPTVDYSLVAGGAQRHQFQACLPYGHHAQCRSFYVRKLRKPCQNLGRAGDRYGVHGIQFRTLSSAGAPAHQPS